METQGAMFYQYLINRIRSIAATLGLFGSMCMLGVTVLGMATLVVVSLIPLYLNQNTDEVLGEYYCINNYSLTVGFEIPEYNTTFTSTLATQTYSFTTGQVTVPVTDLTCTNAYKVNLTTSETVSVGESCSFQLFSIISPKIPNAKVFDNYALDEACYRTLQNCYSDSLLSACILSNCVVDSLVASSTLSYPLTNYTLRCSANIYYKTRCTDTPASYGLSYSSSQNNGACRQQRFDRINTCLNSTVQLSNVPCLISVSSGIVTSPSGTCSQVAIAQNNQINVLSSGGVTVSLGNTGFQTNSPLTVNFPTTGFSASDQDDGHVYRISSVNSATYASSQSGALYCGTITQAQISTSINAAVNSQSSK